MTIASIAVPTGQAGAQRIGVSVQSDRPAYVTAVMHTQATTSSCDRSRWGTVGQFTSGLVGAWAGGIVSYATINNLDEANKRVKGDAGYVPNANTAFAIGSWVGSTLGVFLAGPRGCGSLGKTALGTGIPSAPMLLGRHEPYLPLLGVVLVAPLQALFGTVMFPKR